MQAELVRYALEATRAEIEGRPRPPLSGAVKRDILSLAGSLAGGPSLADELVEDRRWEARRDSSGGDRRPRLVAGAPLSSPLRRP